jgi:recombination protein RecR
MKSAMREHINAANDNPLQRLMALLAKLPGLGPRSARRAALALMKKPEALLEPLVAALEDARANLADCSQCGNLDCTDPCAICADPRRDHATICVVADVGDLWAIERSHVYKGLYHVLGGTLSAFDGVTPSDLRMAALSARLAAAEGAVREVILALSATLEGQTTAHVLAEQLEASGVQLTRLAHGLPSGAELDYMDDGTLTSAFRARQRTA